jgi:hypothetical protein
LDPERTLDKAHAVTHPDSFVYLMHLSMDVGETDR